MTIGPSAAEGSTPTELIVYSVNASRCSIETVFFSGFHS